MAYNDTKNKLEIVYKTDATLSYILLESKKEENSLHDLSMSFLFCAVAWSNGCESSQVHLITTFDDEIDP